MHLLRSRSYQISCKVGGVHGRSIMDEDDFGDGQEFNEVEDSPLKPTPIRGKKRGVAEPEVCCIYECVETNKEVFEVLRSPHQSRLEHEVPSRAE